MAGLFVVFEGLDGAGKSTQVDLLRQSLEERGRAVIATREPGGTAIGDAIRDIMLGRDHRPLLPITQAFLMNAARAELVERVIQPALEQDYVVVSDRYWYSTLAYQSAGDGVSPEAVAMLSATATGGLDPDIVFLLDVPPGHGLSRKRERDKNPLDRRGPDFYERVRRSYEELSLRREDQWVRLDATRPPGDLAVQVLRQTLAAIDEAEAAPVTS
ncbi:MAG TPA: dTMP kinase [Chloroflexota bacterium]|nr:dTMP kinase [Chloroflexota bacterium]